MSVCRTYDAIHAYAQHHGGNQGANPDQLKEKEALGPAEAGEHVGEQQAYHGSHAID
jgi:hypothetical protein